MIDLPDNYMTTPAEQIYMLQLEQAGVEFCDKDENSEKFKPSEDNPIELIPIPPEGYELAGYRGPYMEDEFINPKGEVDVALMRYTSPRFILKRKEADESKQETEPLGRCVCGCVKHPYTVCYNCGDDPIAKAHALQPDTPTPDESKIVDTIADIVMDMAKRIHMDGGLDEVATHCIIERLMKVQS